MIRSRLTPKRLTRLAAGLLLLPFALAAARADDAPHPAGHYQGQVTSLDTTAKTFVVQARTSETPITVKTTDATKVAHMTNIGLEGLKVGDKVYVSGELSPDAATVTPKWLIVLGEHAPTMPLVANKSVTGKVATTAPALTLTTEDGKTVTVSAQSAFPVAAPKDAAFSNIVVGSQVNVKGAKDGDMVTADSVTIASWHGSRFHPHLKPDDATGDKPIPVTPAPATPPTKPNSTAKP